MLHFHIGFIAIIFKATSSEVLRQSNRDVYTEVKPYKCEKCGKTFKTKCYLRRHDTGVHIEVKLHRCGVCSKTFKTKRDLRRHEITHADIKLYQCEFCGKLFK